MICIRLAGDVLRQVTKAPFGGRERIVEIGRCRGRNGAEHAFIGGIDHGLTAGAFPAPSI
jgi:hypothetical protein